MSFNFAKITNTAQGTVIRQRFGELFEVSLYATTHWVGQSLCPHKYTDGYKRPLLSEIKSATALEF
jgi:hypothetical protein